MSEKGDKLEESAVEKANRIVRIEACGFGVEKEKIGTVVCTGCHFAMKDGTCSWTEEDGVRELDGPTSHPEPMR